MAPTLLTLEKDIDQALVDERERYWIAHYIALGADLTNMAHGHVTPQETSGDTGEYMTAAEATELLTQLHGRPFIISYISKMAKSKKHRLRTVQFGNRLLYNRADVAACHVVQKSA